MSEPALAPAHFNAVREEIARILSHALFVRSDRMGRFLTFVVERLLEGKAEELKEFAIGLEVFDRDPSYDPRVDPIVRVEARRLRSKLKAYYDTDGRRDAVVIELSPGSYVPKVRVKAEAVAAPESAAVAVLPFSNLSPNQESDYFSDGLTEELIHALTKVPGLLVVAWNTATQMRGRQDNMPEIRRQLKVDAVLTGSVRIAGAGLRVRAQLIDTESGVYLWSETFDRQMQDVFAIQEEIARAIVRTLRVQLAPAARSRSNVGSYDWYLKGRYLANRRVPADLERSLECFQNAIAADPNSALAYAGLADAYSLLMDYGMVPPAEYLPAAKAAAQRAIALDPDLGEAYASLAIIRSLHEWQWEEGELLYLRAIELNPGYAPAHHWLAIDHYAILGRFDEANTEIDIACRLDPLSGIIMEGRAYLYLLGRRYQEAIVAGREILHLDPSFYKAYTGMGRAYSLMGSYDDALAMLEKGRAIAGEIPSILGAIGQVHALRGEVEEARAILARLEELAERRYVASSCFAIVHMGLGDFDRCFEWLEKGCELREPPLAALKSHPLYDQVRGQPRFQALLRRMRLD